MDGMDFLITPLAKGENFEQQRKLTLYLCEEGVRAIEKTNSSSLRECVLHQTKILFQHLKLPLS
jgi:hypothetical protein